MKTRKHRRLVGKIALGLAVAAVAAPVAQAEARFNNAESGAPQTVVPMTHGVGATMQDYLEYRGLPASAQHTYGVGATAQDWLEYKGTAGTPGTTVRTDLPCTPNCAAELLPSSVSTEFVRPAPADLEPVGTPRAQSEFVRPAPADLEPAGTPETLVRPAPTSFDWTDAGIGAGFAFGLVLLASGMALVARRHRQTSVAAF
jgi:hypothetical protein